MCHLDTRTKHIDPQKERVNGHALQLSDSQGTCQSGTYTAYPIHVNGHIYSGPFGMRIGSRMCWNAYQTTETTCRMACAHNPKYALIKCAYSMYQRKSLRVCAKSAHAPSNHQWDRIKIDQIPKTCRNAADTCPMDMYHLETHAETACFHDPEYNA